jgi:hypothetical protein
MVEEKLAEERSVSLETPKRDFGPLASHIYHSYERNRDTRRDSLINDMLFDCLRAYNGEYSTEELALIKEEGGSQIFMNLTSTKVRAAISWIKDILLATKEDPFMIRRTEVPEIPQELRAQIEERVTKDFETIATEMKGDVAQTLKEANEYKRDLYDAIEEEINKEADFGFRQVQRHIKDSFEEGHFKKALSDFIDDFCIFPTAIMKGPIVTKKKKLKWDNGLPVVTDEYVKTNRRVSPFDVYPAPESCSPQEGDFIEHVRYSSKELSSLMAHKAYDGEAIREVLRDGIGKGYPLFYDTEVEDLKNKEELREDSFTANENTYHGVHFWGSIPVSKLREWTYKPFNLEGLSEEDEIEVEAIMVGEKVILCRRNKDPLGRRPYFASSFQKRPGSFWGSCPPWLMRDIQRMCNACARALSNNMGLASGPIMELYVDRLADGQDISELRPRDIVQVTTDPSGASGRAVQFFAIPSIANELLAVYKEFELKADDVTMIPRYAYGNERTGGAAQTASGLSMLLESASKGIKDAIRHIDEDVIIPRVKAEFYMIMVQRGAELKFSGDIEVVALGSSTLTMKGAEQMRRNEFLQITANAVDQEIIGPMGRAQILRTVAKELGLGENIVPSRQELKRNQKKKEEAQSQQASTSVQTVQMQSETAMQIAQMNAQMKEAEIQRKRDKDQTDAQIKVVQMNQEDQARREKSAVDLQKVGMKNQSEEHRANQAIALSLETGDRANSV